MVWKISRASWSGAARRKNDRFFTFAAKARLITYRTALVTLLEGDFRESMQNIRRVINFAVYKGPTSAMKNF